MTEEKVINPKVWHGMKFRPEWATCGPGPIGPMPRGPLILCIGPKLGWPASWEKQACEENGQDCFHFF